MVQGVATAPMTFCTCPWGSDVSVWRVTQVSGSVLPSFHQHGSLGGRILVQQLFEFDAAVNCQKIVEY